MADTGPCSPDLPQVEILKAYFAKQVDEISLQQADVVLVLQQEDGEHRGQAGVPARVWSTLAWAATLAPTPLLLLLRLSLIPGAPAASSFKVSPSCRIKSSVS